MLKERFLRGPFMVVLVRVLGYCAEVYFLFVFFVNRMRLATSRTSIVR